jgi:hypothetical protein
MFLELRAKLDDALEPEAYLRQQCARFFKRVMLLVAVSHGSKSSIPIGEGNLRRSESLLAALPGNCFWQSLSSLISKLEREPKIEN